MNDLEIPQERRDLIEPFTVYGFDLYNIGSCFTWFGGKLGIPSFFYYSCPADIDKRNIHVNFLDSHPKLFIIIGFKKTNNQLINVDLTHHQWRLFALNQSFLRLLILCHTFRYKT